MIYELRRYTLRAGGRETLTSLFEREFIESQEAAGMRVLGVFHEVDRPDTFPWLRAFPDMEARKASLEAFYGGPVWATHRDAANATMLDSDDVLLLHSTGPEPPSRERPPVGSGERPASLYVITIYHVEGDDFAAFFAEQAVPALAAAGVPPIACFETEHAENTFPRLPVREGENVFAWIARFGTPEEERVVELPMIAHRLTAPAERLRLRPTVRSSLR